MLKVREVKNLVDTDTENKIILDIKKKVLDICLVYGNNGLKIAFNIPPNCTDEKYIKAEIGLFNK